MRSIAAALSVLLVGAAAADAKKISLKLPKAGQASALVLTVKAKGAKKPRPKLKGRVPAGVGVAVAVRRTKRARTYTELLVVVRRGAKTRRTPVAHTAQDFGFGAGVQILPGVTNRGVTGAQRAEGFLGTSLPSVMCVFSTTTPSLTGGLLAGSTNSTGFSSLLGAGCGKTDQPSVQGYLCSYNLTGCAPPPGGGQITPAFSFAAGPTFSPPSGLVSVALARMDGDALQDVVTGDTGGFSVFPQAAGGTFGAPVAVSAGFNPVAVAVGDFNGDGKQDIAGISQSGTLNDFLGNGSGGFTANPSPFVFLSSGAPFTSLAVGRFNGDALDDLAVPQADGQMAVLLGQSNGSFSGVDYAAGGAGFAGVAVAVGDFNGDGHTDIVGAQDQGSDHRLVFLPGQGDGTFGLPQPVPVSSSVSNIAPADLDLDGIVDLAVAESNGIEILSGSGGGAFAAPVALDAGVPVIGVVIGDVNGDSRPDVVGLNRGAGTVDAFLGGGGKTFGAPLTTPFAGGVGIAVGDFNGDGVSDVAAGGSTGQVFLGQK